MGRGGKTRRGRATGAPTTREARREAFDLDTYLDDWAAEWSEFSPEVLDLVVKHAEEVQEASGTYKFLDCGEASSAWYRVFHEAGIPVRKVTGYYHEGLNSTGQIEDEEGGLLSPPGSSEHAWLEVEGRLFDPTASQFVFEDKPFSMDNYFVEEYFEGSPEDEDDESLWKTPEE